MVTILKNKKTLYILIPGFRSVFELNNAFKVCFVFNPLKHSIWAAFECVCTTRRSIFFAPHPSKIAGAHC